MKTSTNVGPSLPPTNRLAQQMRQHPLVFFSLMAFGWSWAVDVLFLGIFRQSAGSIAEALHVIVPGLIGAPTFPALLMTALTEGRAGMIRLLRRLVLWRVGLRWYLFVLVGFPILLLLSFLLVPGAIASLREPLLLVSYIPALIVILLVGGPLAEEPAWRGRAKPRLEQRAGPLSAAFVKYDGHKNTKSIRLGRLHRPICFVTKFKERSTSNFPSPPKLYLFRWSF
jgi:membrane protease YdiL (CAAX protease family)